MRIVVYTSRDPVSGDWLGCVASTVIDGTTVFHLEEDHEGAFNGLIYFLNSNGFNLEED